MKQLLSGNEAIARGAYEAGAVVGSAYPGTPSTEIFENLPQYRDAIYAEWAPNEKVAVEVAYGASLGGVRAFSAMKHVGVNVAADPIFTAAYNGVGRGFVIISADDPSMHSSQNEQDNRYYAKAAKLILIEPSDSQECKDFMAEAFSLSEQFDMPALLRVTTRLCHSKSLVELGERRKIEPYQYKRNIAKNVSTPAHAYRNRAQLEEKLRNLAEYAVTSRLNQTEWNGKQIGVITSGIAYQYAKEVFPEDASFLKLGLTYPLPLKLIRDFAAQVETLYVIEELDPFLEEQIKAAGIACIGKEQVPAMYELNPTRLREALFAQKTVVQPVEAEVVARPPALCPGCPHRGFFYTLSKKKNAVIAGDIGCYTLGCAPPLNAMDSVVCMGGGFTVAMGFSKAFAMSGETDRIIFGVVGDSTFFHSGMTGAIEIMYNQGHVIPCILDNSITSMTGQQDNPGTGKNLSGEIAQKIEIEKVMESFGYRTLVVDPQDLKAMTEAVDAAVEAAEPTALIVRRPCLLIKSIKHDLKLCHVDHERCRSCRMCLKVGCPAIAFKDGKSSIDPVLCVGCEVCLQVCPFQAIKKGGIQ